MADPKRVQLQCVTLGIIERCIFILKRLDGMNFLISHSYRETNAITDGLAKSGANGLDGMWFSASYTTLIRGLIRLDKGYFPYNRNS